MSANRYAFNDDLLNAMFRAKALNRQERALMGVSSAVCRNEWMIPFRPIVAYMEGWSGDRVFREIVESGLFKAYWISKQGFVMDSNGAESELMFVRENYFIDKEWKY